MAFLPGRDSHPLDYATLPGRTQDLTPTNSLTGAIILFRRPQLGKFNGISAAIDLGRIHYDNKNVHVEHLRALSGGKKIHGG